MNNTDRRWSTTSDSSNITKFPDFEPAPSQQGYHHEDLPSRQDTDRREPAAGARAWSKGSLQSERWAARRDQSQVWANGFTNGWPKGHSRQKSLTDAIRTIRGRKASVSVNAQEIAQALRAPISVKLVVCLSECYAPRISCTDESKRSCAWSGTLAPL